MRQQMSNLIEGLEPKRTHVVGFGGSMDERARGWELGASTVLGQRRLEEGGKGQGREVEA